MITALLALAWTAAGLAALAALMTAFNLLTWPRGRQQVRHPGRVSVLVPARNEEASIGACVDALLAQEHPLHEVLVLDDGSTDRTAEILAARASGPRLRVLTGDGLPDGWVGKPHACHVLGHEATGDLLLFVDADVTLDSAAVGRIAALLDRHRADLLTAVPGQVTGSWMEHLILPLLHLTYTAWLPLVLIHLTQDPRFLAANGQILAVRADAYRAIGGFEAVKNEVVDDMAFCGAAKRAGKRVLFADGSTLARCRMYASPGEVWRGFSKNLYEGLGESPLRLLAVGSVYFLAFIAPFLLLPLALAVPLLAVPALVGVGLNVVTRVALAVRFGHHPLGVLGHPIAVVLLLGIALNSWRWARRGQIEWAGRTYAARSARGA